MQGQHAFNPHARMVVDLESFVAPDHFLRRVNRVVDFRFIRELTTSCYASDGRPSIDPEVIIRLFLIQAMEGIPRVRELMRQVQVNLAYRWFIGYELEEALPDHSTLSKALSRLGDEIFDELFTRSIDSCRSSGLVEGKVLHVDATTIRADIDANRVAKPDSPDSDARFGRFPDRKLRPGYKQHTVADDLSRVVLGMTVTPADRQEHDEAVGLVDAALVRLGSPPEAVCGDGAYGSGANAAAMEQRGIRFITPPPKAKTYTGDTYFTVEDFTYDEEKDVFVCPGKKQLKYVRTEKQRGRRIYHALRSACRSCPLKSQCTKSDRRSVKVTAHHGSLVRLRADSKTEEFGRLYRSRAPVIEGVFGEAKQWHSLGRAWRRGLTKMRVQCLLIATVINLKKVMAALGSLFATLVTLQELLRRIWRPLEPNWQLHSRLSSLNVEPA